MDYEKLYKEALERAKEDISSGILARRETARYIFPELRESSEEMVRRTIISTLYRDDYLSTEEVNECVAWLEKQSKEDMIEALRMEYEKGKADGLQEQRKEWNEEDERIKNWIVAKLTQTCRNATGEEDKDVVEKYHKALAWLEKQGEQVIDANKMIEQKWNKEDERIRKKIIATINLYYGAPLEEEAKEMIAWLKKQNKQILANSAKTCKDEQKHSNLESIGEIWSKEDEEILDKLITNYENGYLPPVAERCEYIIWLKSLKSHPRLELSAEDLEWFEKQGKLESTWSKEDSKIKTNYKPICTP